MKWTPICAIVSITTLVIVALCHGIDGAVYGLGIASVAGIGGYEIKTYIRKRNGEDK